MTLRLPSGQTIRRRQRRVNVVQRLRRDVNMLKSNLDINFIDAAFTDAVVSATGDIQPQLFTIPDGDAQGEKNGIKIVIKSIQFHFQLKLPSTATVADGTDVFRAILVVDKQANGALPAVDDILVGTDITDFKNLQNKARFRTLFDKTMSISTMGLSSAPLTSPNTKSWNYFKKLNVSVLYNKSAATGAVTTINSNNLVLLFISEAGKCGINAEVRIRYTD